MHNYCRECAVRKERLLWGKNRKKKCEGELSVCVFACAVPHPSLGYCFMSIYDCASMCVCGGGG